MTSLRRARIKPADQVWSLKQVVNAHPVDIVKSKDGRVYVSFESGGKKSAEQYPANFHAQVSSEKDLADLLAIALTYPAVP